MPIDKRAAIARVLDELVAAMDDEDKRRLTGGGEIQPPENVAEEEESEDSIADGPVQPLDELPIAQEESSGDTGAPPDDDEKGRLKRLMRK